MYIGNKNKNFIYNIGGVKQKTGAKEKDLGVIIDKNYKFSKKCASAAKKANQMLGIIEIKVKNKKNYCMII